MNTFVVQIGNSDNKLTQQQWAEFYISADTLVKIYAHRLHFAGASFGGAPWQNAAWIGETSDAALVLLRGALAQVAREWSQDSIALTIGQTEFIK